MTELLSPDAPRRLLADLCRLASERATAGREVHAGFAARNEAAEKEYQDARRALEERHEEKKAGVDANYDTKRRVTEAKFQAELDAVQKEYETVKANALARFTSDQQAAQQALQDAHWEATEAADAARGGLNLPLKDLLAGLDSRWEQLGAIHNEAVELLRARGHWDDLPETPAMQVRLENHPGRRFCHALDEAQSHLRTLTKQRLPQLFQSWRPWAIFLAIWLVAALPTFAFFKWTDWRWAAISGGAAIVIGLVAGIWTYRIAKRKSVEAYLALRKTMLEAGLGHSVVLETAKSECQRLDATIIARHKAQSQKADQAFAAATARIEQRRQKELRDADAAYPQRLTELAARRDRVLADIDAKGPPLLRRIEEEYAAESQRIEEQHAAAVEDSQRRFEHEWNEMANRWWTGLERFRLSATEADEKCRAGFPNWNTDDWLRWTPPSALPAAVALGRSHVSLADIPNGIPKDERLRPAQTDFALPVVLPFPRHSLLLLKAAGQGRTKAVDLLQSGMLRLLTSLPPSKIRFTILDPIGLGDNFSAFMHLADFDEQLVSSRIWTDTVHIEQRLADLTKHMENVIQVYLRQEFHSIEEYNEFAGEMAEPYRVLVVANFPANFSEASLARLKSIVASGARCGVFVMLSVDTDSPMPRNFRLADLEADAMTFDWVDGHFAWEHPDFGPVAVDFDMPPQVERMKEIVRTVGAAAKESGHVEVPFSCIIPPESEWWTTDSRAGIDVPLGRAGAMKLQHLDLGHGTSQHVLISGKTGSGKSTLLHVLITNLALRYSPDEVELYLVDFKKGVEFKAYARSLLPHARVIAIESEREFGLSVLQRLDIELRNRGDLFRKLGTQDVKGYRAAVPDARMPRILLVIDEFQELFVEDDRIAQESALLLDRLVRQGRAFGIHVLLGSQTLGGAYTLARSTIGQMAVRIALQCSEADAHLILSEDNTAARLLNRPGEAIYNDANGLYEGNHPFQIVWLADGDRDAYLGEVTKLQQERHCAAPPPIVFEGNVLADLADNPRLHEVIASPDWPEVTPKAPAWLGSAVAIKDPTSAVFLRQNGSNLLIVGHREEAALGVLASSFVSLAARHSPRLLGEGTGVRAANGAESPHPNPLPEGEGTCAPMFYILDGMRSDAPETGFWNRLTSAVPQESKIGGVRNATEIIGEVAAELASRQQAGHENAPPLYLFLYNLGRFRELRKEDDFGYSSDEKPASPAKQFGAILREGPPLGIHTLVWCDTYTNVGRMLDRQNMQDFEMRVLFQMNANDSSSLMDSPEASRLGVHRAILYDEGQGLVEKFRPYGLPSAEYLAWVKERLHGRP